MVWLREQESNLRGPHSKCGLPASRHPGLPLGQGCELPGKDSNLRPPDSESGRVASNAPGIDCRRPLRARGGLSAWLWRQDSNLRVPWGTRGNNPLRCQLRFTPDRLPPADGRSERRRLVRPCVRLEGLEPPFSWSQTRRPTNWPTTGCTRPTQGRAAVERTGIEPAVARLQTGCLTVWPPPHFQHATAERTASDGAHPRDRTGTPSRAHGFGPCASAKFRQVGDAFSGACFRWGP